MVEPSVTLTDFEVVLPRFRVEQAEANRWTLDRHLASIHHDPDFDEGQIASFPKLFSRYAVKPDLIEARFVECPDVLHDDIRRAEIYPIGPGRISGADIGRRTQFFSDRAFEVFRELYPRERGDLSHLIHVTCTGYRSPSAAQRLVAQRGWGRDVGITHAYHMGCYASLPAIRIGEALALARESRVDIVHTEMCGLHMNAAAHSPEQIVVQSLFADGHVKYSVRRSGDDTHGLRLLRVQEEVVAESEADMSWMPQPWGLQMNLSREVPGKIGAVIDRFFVEMAREAGMSPGHLQETALFAVHPGGPKIIQTVQQALGLRDEQVAQSRLVLRERGNMSSATLPHVWREILRASPARGTKVVSFAFGPGLTVFGALFEVV